MASFVEVIRHVPDRLSIIGPAIVVFLLVAAFLSANRNSNKAPALKDPVPYIWNAYHYMTDMQGFLRRVRYVPSSIPSALSSSLQRTN